METVMSNSPGRKVRRAGQRAAEKRDSKGGSHVVRPTNQHGFEADKVGGRVVATFHLGYSTFTVDYDTVDARRIGEMFIEASDRDEIASEIAEVVRGGSGLVIAKDMPPGMKR